VDLSPDALAASGGLDGALRRARARQPTGWLRGIGYDVAASGRLDHDRLDAIDVGPVRIQDRTGILWHVDGTGLAELLPADHGEPAAPPAPADTPPHDRENGEQPSDTGSSDGGGATDSGK